MITTYKKRLFLLLLIGLLFFAIFSLNNTKKDELSAIILEIHENTILVESNDSTVSGKISISFPLNNKEPLTSFNIGDTICFQYDGAILESYPMQIPSVTKVYKVR